MQIYSYHGGDDLRKGLEVYTHTHSLTDVCIYIFMCVHACNCIVVSDYISVMITGYLSPCVDNYVSAMKHFFFFFSRLTLILERLMILPFQIETDNYPS